MTPINYGNKLVNLIKADLEQSIEFQIEKSNDFLFYKIHLKFIFYAIDISSIQPNQSPSI